MHLFQKSSKGFLQVVFLQIVFTDKPHLFKSHYPGFLSYCSDFSGPVFRMIRVNYTTFGTFPNPEESLKSMGKPTDRVPSAAGSKLSVQDGIMTRSALLNKSVSFAIVMLFSVT